MIAELLVYFCKNEMGKKLLICPGKTALVRLPLSLVAVHTQKSSSEATFIAADYLDLFIYRSTLIRYALVDVVALAYVSADQWFLGPRRTSRSLTRQRAESPVDVQ